MKFCSRCGNPLTKKSTTHFTCTKCHVDHYKNPKGAAAILLFTQAGQLILARRGKAPHKGKLDPLGGFLDSGENFEQALFRELKEETGLTKADITPPTYFGSAHDYYPWQREKESVVSVYFTATLTSDIKLAAQDDVASLVYLNVSDIPDNELAWDGLRSMLKLLKTKEEH